MANRRRSKEWKTRLTEEEYQKLKAEVEKLGITCQEYGERTLFHRIVLNREERETLEKMLEETKGVKLQLRKIGVNLNQLAHVANATGNVGHLREIQNLQDDLNYYGMEVDDVWQSLKQLQNRRKR